MQEEEKKNEQKGGEGGNELCAREASLGGFSRKNARPIAGQIAAREVGELLCAVYVDILTGIDSSRERLELSVFCFGTVEVWWCEVHVYKESARGLCFEPVLLLLLLW